MNRPLSTKSTNNGNRLIWPSFCNLSINSGFKNTKKPSFKKLSIKNTKNGKISDCCPLSSWLKINGFWMTSFLKEQDNGTSGRNNLLPLKLGKFKTTGRIQFFLKDLRNGRLNMFLARLHHRLFTTQLPTYKQFYSSNSPTGKDSPKHSLIFVFMLSNKNGKWK